MDEVVDTANSIVQQLGLDIDFVLDGSVVAEFESSATQCLIQRWRPWPMTWQPGFNSPNALISNDTSKGYDRLAVLDAMILDYYNQPIIDPAFWIKYLKKRNFGKFPHSKLPWLVWEPDDQFSIMAVSKVYL